MKDRNQKDLELFEPSRTISRRRSAWVPSAIAPAGRSAGNVAAESESAEVRSAERLIVSTTVALGVRAATAR